MTLLKFPAEQFTIDAIGVLLFKGLTQRAQRILINYAQDEARRAGARQLLPEHIIIAILKEGKGIASEALVFLRIDTDEFRHALEKALPALSGFAAMPEPSQAAQAAAHNRDLPPANRTKILLTNATEEARSMDNEYLGTDHLLFAAMREPGSIVQTFLNERALDADMMQIVVKKQFHKANSRGDHERISPGDYHSFLIHRERQDQQKRGGEGFGGFSAFERPRIKPTAYPVLTPTLDNFSRDLTAMAKAGKIDPVVGRKAEINRVLRIVARRTKNNPILAGEPGVGKTAIVEGFALLLAGDAPPEAVAGKRLLALDIGQVVAGTKYRGEFEERMKKIMREIAQAGNIILFIDEIHTIIGAGGAEGTIDASNMLKPGLSRGEIHCIGATTLGEYRRHFERDAALERRFQAVLVEEPSLEETQEILQGISKKYEDHHHVKYAPGALKVAATLAARYITGRFMPDKAIDIMDEAGAMRKLENRDEPPEIADIESEIILLSEEKSTLVSAQDYERAAEVRDKVRALKSRLENARLAWERSFRKERPLVDEADMRRVVAEATGIPVMHMEDEQSQSLLKMEAEIGKTLIGQEAALERVASAIRRSRAGISSLKRPMGSFIFLGPTGVGKTLLAKRLAFYLFGSEESLVRIDMSDFMEKHNASRLVGAPPGYIGYEEGGMLTEKIRRNPYRVVLFDEIEKAHRDLFNLLLQVMEEGELKDSLGHSVSFRNTVIIMTSNAGVREISNDSRLGFSADSGMMSAKEIEGQALAELRRLFNPEFINRVDEIVVFHPLEKKQIEAILDIELAGLYERLAEKGFSLELKASARKILIEKGWDQKFGGRPLRRTIQKEIEDPLSQLVLAGKWPAGTVFRAQGRGESVKIYGKEPAASGDEAAEKDSELSFVQQNSARI